MAMTDSTYTTPLTENLQTGDTVYVQLTGTDWHNSFAEPALVIMQTGHDQYGIAVALIETDTATGIYQGRAYLSATSDDALNHIGTNQDDTLIVFSHIDNTKRDTIFIGGVGISEHQSHLDKTPVQQTTIISGPLHLPADRRYRIFDAIGRIVQPNTLKQGIYFLEIDGVIVRKVVKVK
jgi:hypothetical protein